MKKILFLLLVTISSYGQTLQNPTFGNTTTNTLKIKTPATVTSVNFLSTNEADGSVSKISPINVNIPYTPINYSAPTQTIGNHLLGIDTRLGALSSTSAGLTQRVWLTADNTTVTAGTFFASNPLNKGATATGSPTALVLGDNVKAYFNKDLISGAQPATTIGYAGTYSGNLTVSATPTPNATQQRFTLEVYRCNNGGTPIASGVSGAPTGDLGVTVVAILDSGLVNLVAGSISNVSIQGTLTQNITINTGERLRYHVSAQKVGTGGGNVTFGVYYGSSYNSYYDVPVAITTDAVLNKSTVAGITATDALNNLNAKIPVNYSKIVYVNNNNPNSATIFDLNNPPLVNDNALKTDVNNLYVGLDASGWVYNSTSLNYVTKTVTSETSNFYLSGTTTDAGNSKTAAIYRTGSIAAGINVPTAKIHAYEAATGSNRLVYGESNLTPTAGVTMNQGIAFVQASTEALNPGYSVFGFNVNPQSSAGITSGVATNADSGNVPLIMLQGQRVANIGGSPSTSINRPIFGVSNYSTRLITTLVNGNTGILTSNPIGKFEIFTGLSGFNTNIASIPFGSVSFANGNSSTAQPTITGKSDNNTGLVLISATNDINSAPDFVFDVRENDNSSFTTLSTTAFRFNRFGSALMDILRNGNVGIGVIPTTTATDKLQVNGNITANAGTASNHAVIKSQLDLKADLASPIFTGNPTAPTPTAGDNDTSIATTAFISNQLEFTERKAVALGHNSTVLSYSGLPSFTLVGTIGSNPVHALSTKYANILKVSARSSTTAASYAGWWNADVYSIYFVPDIGWTSEFYWSDDSPVNITDKRVFIGFKEVVSPIGTNNPGALTRILGMGSDDSDTNYQIIYPTSPTTTGKIDLGSNFNKNTVKTDSFHFKLWKAVGSRTVYYSVRNVINGNVASGNFTYASGLDGMVGLDMINICNGATAAEARISISEVKTKTYY